MKINLFDNNNPIENKYLNIYWPFPEVEYIRPGIMEFDGISLFTDEMCFDPIVDQVKSKYKVAWSLESPMVKPHLHKYAYHIQHKFDQIYLFNPPFGPKFKKCHPGNCWIVPSNCKVYPKSKLVSIVASNKNWLPGHLLRHEIIKRKLHDDLELWGSGYNWFDDTPEGRIKPYADYRYSIAVENCQYPNYFSEKIMDCFATGTIPIYCGNPRIGELFYPGGFYQFNTIEELDKILKKISIEDYNSRMPYVQKNFELMERFASPDKWMYENCFKHLQ